MTESGGEGGEEGSTAIAEGNIEGISDSYHDSEGNLSLSEEGEHTSSEDSLEAKVQDAPGKTPSKQGLSSKIYTESRDTKNGVSWLIYDADEGSIWLESRPNDGREGGGKLYPPGETSQMYLDSEGKIVEYESPQDTRDRGMDEEMSPKDSVEAAKSLENRNILKAKYHGKDQEGKDYSGISTVNEIMINRAEHPELSDEYDKVEDLEAKEGGYTADMGTLKKYRLLDLSKMDESKFAFGSKHLVDEYTRMHYSNQPHVLLKSGISLDGNGNGKTEGRETIYFNMNLSF